jgi:hypothetical protein
MLIYLAEFMSLIFYNKSLTYVNHFVKGKENARVADRRDLVDDCPLALWGRNPEDGSELKMERRSIKRTRLFQRLLTCTSTFYGRICV